MANENVSPIIPTLSNPNLSRTQILEFYKQSGFTVFPVETNGKTPLQKKFNEPNKTLRPWQKGNNYGVSLYTYRDPILNLALVVLDVDNKPDQPDRNGIPQYEALRERFNLPTTYTVMTPNNGFHYYFFADADLIKSYFPTVPNHPPQCDGIDIRAYKNMVVGPCSTLSGLTPDTYEPLPPYTIVDQTVKPQRLPIEFLQVCATNSPNKTSSNILSQTAQQDTQSLSNSLALGATLDSPENIASATIKINSYSPEEASHNRNNFFYRLAGDIKRLGISQQLNHALISNLNQSLNDPLNSQEFNQTIISAYTYNSNQIGSDTPQAAQALLITDNQALDNLPDSIIAYPHSLLFPEITKNNFEQKLQTLRPNGYRAKSLSDLRQTVFTTIKSGKHYYIRSHITNNPYGHNQMIHHSMCSESDMVKDYASIYLNFASRDARKSKGVAEERPTNIIKVAAEKGTLIPIEQVQFAPGKPIIFNGSYNTYQGNNFNSLSQLELESLTPTQQNLFDEIKEQVFKEYFFKVLSCNDTKKYHYILSWLGKLIQEPSWTPMVAMGFNGNKGTGKSFLYEKLLSGLLGEHQVVAYANMDSYLSNFNSEQAFSRVIIHEESVNPKASKDTGTIKHALTTTRIMSEAKFQDKEMVTRYHGFLIFSNNDHFIHAETDERRYFVARVSNTRIQDRVFFNGMVDLLNSDDLNGWKYLYTMLSDPQIITQDPDIAYETEELSTQIQDTVDTGDPFLAFIKSRIIAGKRFDADDNFRIQPIVPEGMAPDDPSLLDPAYDIMPQDHANPHDCAIVFAFRNYEAYCKDNYSAGFLSYNKLSKKGFTSKLIQTQDGIIQGHIINTDKGKLYNKLINGVRTRVVIIPALSDVEIRLKAQLKMPANATLV